MDAADRAADIAWTYKTNPTLGETVGWPQFVRTVDGVWKSLPQRQRASVPVHLAVNHPAHVVRHRQGHGDERVMWRGQCDGLNTPARPACQAPSA